MPGSPSEPEPASPAVSGASSAAPSGASSPSGTSAPSLAFLALDLLGLGLDDTRRHRDRREDGLLGVVEERHALLHLEVGEAQGVADCHLSDVELEMLGDLQRQRLDRDLAIDLREHAALGHADRLTDELHDDARLDRAVEPHLLQVDVGDPTLDRMLLVVLEDRRVGRVLALERHVEDRVQAVAAGEHAPQLTLGDADRLRVLAATVEHARDQPLLAQAARLRGASALAVLHLQLHSLAGHRRRILARTAAWGAAPCFLRGRRRLAGALGPLDRDQIEQQQGPEQDREHRRDDASDAVDVLEIVALGRHRHAHAQIDQHEERGESAHAGHLPAPTAAYTRVSGGPGGRQAPRHTRPCRR